MVMTMVAVVANVVGAGAVFPQAVRLLRHREVGGVSPVWVVMSLVVNAWWLPYVAAVGDWAIAPVAIASLGAYGAVGFGLVRYWPGDPAPVHSALLAGAAIGAVPLAALIVGGWPATGVSLGLIYGVQLSPAVIAAYRSTDIRGVSATTWLLVWSEALLWTVYGTARLDPGLISFGITGLAVSTAILLRLLSTGNPQHDRDPELHQPERDPHRDPAGHGPAVVDGPDGGRHTLPVQHG